MPDRDIPSEPAKHSRLFGEGFERFGPEHAIVRVVPSKRRGHNLQDGDCPEMMILHSPVWFRERFHEWSAAWIMLWAGIIFLLPYPTFNNPYYTTLANIMTEEHWGLICFGLGAFRLLVLAINGFWLPSYRLRSATAFLSVFFWVQVTLGILWANPFSLGMAVFPALIIGDMYAVYRATLDYKIGLSIRRAYGNESR